MESRQRRGAALQYCGPGVSLTSELLAASVDQLGPARSFPRALHAPSPSRAELELLRVLVTVPK